MFQYDPCQLKGIVIAYIGKETFNMGGITLHYEFHLPFKKLEYLFLKGEILETLTKHFERLYIILIDEVSLRGSTLLYHVEKLLYKLKHTLLAYFGNIDVIFSSDLFQEQPIKCSMIFEQLILAGEKLVYNFSKESQML